MKNLMLLLFVPLAFMSCIEELDTLETNFEKVYGFNLNSKQNGISQNTDGTYLIYGRAERSIIDNEDYYQLSKDAAMPMLIKIDQHGNEIMKRTYPIDQVEYEFNPGADLYDGNVNFAEFRDAVELKNSKYLTVFRVYSDYWLSEGFMLLDEKLNVEKVQLLDDFELEFQDTPFVSRRFHKVFNSPNKNEVLLLATESFYLTPDFRVKYLTSFYSIFRLSLNGTLVDLYDYNISEKALFALDMIFDAEGNAIVVAQVFYPGTSTIIHKIDLQTGNILKEVELNTGSNPIFSPKILSIENGYAIGARENVERYSSRFSIGFLDQDFNFTNRVSYPERKYSECGPFSFIPMTSGGFCVLTFTCDANYTVVRLDSKGNEIWRREGEGSANDGSMKGKLIEASDGGILLLRNKEFNSSGRKITLIKFDADGNL